MGSRAIAFMLLETVPRMVGPEFLHMSIARHLGDDRGKGDCGDVLVAPNERFLLPFGGD